MLRSRRHRSPGRVPFTPVPPRPAQGALPSRSWLPATAGAAAIAATAGLMLAAPDSHAAGRPDLRTLSVSAPASATSGALLPVRVVASASGSRAPRVGFAVYLSADAKRSKSDMKLTSTERLPRLASGRSRTVPLAVTIPVAQAPGKVRVIVCLDDAAKVRERSESNNCRAARQPLTIAAPSTDPATAGAAAPAARIAAELAAGKLTPAKALEYRVLARFGDPKLPAQYAGDPGDAEDDGVLREAASAWADLPKPTRKAIGEYFLPPPVRQALEQDPSALVRAKGGKGAKRGKRNAAADRLGDDSGVDAADEDAAPEVCATEYTRVKTWDNVSAAGGKVRLHWERSKPEDGAKAKALVGDVTRAYARFKQMLGSEPLSDANVGCYHGPDGALDIYVTPVWYKAGVTVPSAQSDQHEADCEGYPGFVAADPDHPRYRLGYTIAHEMFHAFQMAYRYKAGCKDAAWLDEGSATWAGHLIYPADNAEHLFKFVLQYPHDSIENDYHSWVFFLWMEKRFGDAAIRTTYRSLKSTDSTAAVDQGVGLRKEFLDFAKAGWNQEPEASFAAWDGLATVPHVTEGFPSGPVVPVNFHLAGQKERTAYSKFSLRALGRDYKRYPVTDEKLRSLTFKNPLAKNPNVKIGVYLTLASGAVRWEDWSGKDEVKLCRDQPEQDVRDIVLVYANATPAEQFSPADVLIAATPEWALKDSCETDLPWHYEVLWGQLTYHVEGHRPGNANDGLCVLNGFETRDKVDFVGAADGSGFKPGENVFAKTGNGEEIEGDFGITAEKPTRAHVLDGCKGWDNSGPKTQCHATHNDDMGPFEIGFRMTAESRQAQVATLRWGIPPAIAGFFDADDSVCNVGTLDHYLDDPEMYESDVLMTDLAGTKPFTVSLSGDWSWTGPGDLGDKGTLTYSYEAKMRLQRVNADGTPAT
ncbi:MAG: hypothetical protein J7513_09020 [Solirubrobacteraceae bacterium]|nr:hypothetical protein [Solirubrobacteraceae bacterium]